MATNTDIASLGRFSSQILTYLGTQKTVKLVTGQYTNTFKYASTTSTYVNPSSLQQSALGYGVVGSLSPNDYNSTKCYFLSRGGSDMYADAMTAVTIDMAAAQGVTPQSLTEHSELQGKVSFAENSYRVMNQLRDPSHQVGTVTTVDNRNSLQVHQIRA